ncbi:uncharacterized mitochondrial protein AtMg00810-like [Medicago truncatula]|uniref:uncharacterized mitochondrial protein AtMg00810-like n=1 Tax=Medicago truncatula TaxID=3880 RepID=UPI000D2F40B0|nr:uncharacterized mitochondrial protein AtMg00810-like [Medicago truncatula]
MIVTGNNEEEMKVFKKNMMKRFEMSDLGNLTYFLGIEFEMNSQGILIHQRKYAQDVLKRFNMMNCKLISTPIDTRVKLSLVNVEKEVDPTLFKQIVDSLRYLCHTRPDIAYGVDLISRCMVKPTTSHLVAAKRIMRYVKGTSNYAFSWSSKKESVVALSSCEAEYIAASMTACQAQWINILLMELQLVKDEKMELRIDNKSAIDLAKHP